MSRPRPLSNITSARSVGPPEFQSLTPRTPHSRAGRAEEGYNQFELQQITEDEAQYTSHHQTAPLLASSASDTFPASTTGYRSRGDDHDPRIRPQWDKRTGGAGQLQLSTVLARLPLAMGMLLGGFLLFLMYMSYTRPEKLHGYLGILDANKTMSSFDRNATVASDPKLLISYANYTNFPLRPSEYLAECRVLNQGYMVHGKYWEAPKKGVMDVAHSDEEGVCNNTITYMLGGDVGLLADLALLAQAAAVARERNKTFLVDDTYWNRGKWTDHFLDVRDTQPGPEPGCKAPPPEELVACPRLARHWLITAHTAKFHLGHTYSDAYEDAYAHNLNRVKPQFNFAEESLLNTIRPNRDNARLIRKARFEVSSLASPDGAAFDSYVALHLRRGDRGPAFYHGEYVPVRDFVSAGTDAWQRLNPGKSASSLMFYVATDSSTIQREVVGLTAARYTTYSLYQSADPELRGVASPEEYRQKEFDTLEKTARIRATQGMIVDFALLSGAWANEDDALPQATVCTISSNVCKMAAVGLGWERAFGVVDSMGYLDDAHKRWVEIDQKGTVVPVWQPFELF